MLEWCDARAGTSVELLKERIHSAEEEKPLKLKQIRIINAQYCRTCLFPLFLHEQLPLLVSGAPLCAVLSCVTPCISDC